MTTLIIDTSGDYTLLGIAEQTRLVASDVVLHRKELSTSLLPAIQQLVRDYPIQAVAVGIGPGSYTGTRIGVCAAQSLAYGLGIPLISFCSLLAFLPEHEGPFASIVAAKSGSFFVLKWTPLAGFSTHEQVSSDSLEQLLEGIPLRTAPSTPNLAPLPAFLYDKLVKKDFTLPGQLQLLYLS